MSVVELSDTSSGSSARIAVEAGFNCFQFSVRHGDNELQILSAEPGFEDGTKPPSHSGIPILFPFPNRIRSGRYTWDGTDYELPESLVSYDGSGNAIHGFCLDRPWRVVEQAESFVTGVFQLSQDAPDRLALWPADAELTVQYTLTGHTLRSKFTVRNPDDKPLPWGVGTHSYFRLPLGGQTAERCRVYAPVVNLRELESCLPTGRLTEIPDSGRLQNAPEYGGLKLDDAYSGMQVGSGGHVETWVEDPESDVRVVQRFSADFQELVAFTPPWTTAVCLEPYTCATDAINLQQDGQSAGLRVLEPGGSWNGFIDLEVSLPGD